MSIYAHDSGNRLCPVEANPHGDSVRQNVLVGRRKVRALSETSEAVSAVHCVESGRYQRLDNAAV